MVVELDTDDGTVYQCFECGETFDDRETAVDHEEHCSPPRSM